jgi:hypothetical protein
MAFYCGFFNLFAITDLKELNVTRANKENGAAYSPFFLVLLLRFSPVSFLVSQTPTPKRARIRFRKFAKARL